MKTKMRVIISISAAYPFHPYGGVEKYFFYLSKYLVKEGVDVEIVLPSIGGHKSEVVEGIRYTFIGPPMKGKRPLSSLLEHHLFALNVARYLKKKEFDILHSYDITPYYYTRFSKRVPIVFSPFLLYQGCASGELKSKDRMLLMGPGKYFLRRSLIRYLLHEADAIASEGDFQTEEIAALFNLDKQKIYPIPPGVDISLIGVELKNKTMTRTDLGLDNDLVLISVNRLEPIKGVNYLIDALSLVKQRLEKVKLILIGSGSEEGRIRQQVAGYGLTDNVIFRKNISESALYNYYALSDIYVSPGLQTDFIMGIQEAMVCGLPIVSTGQPWLVKPDENGFIVPPKNPQMIADAVLRMHQNGMTGRMSVKSREIVREYDWKRIARKAIVMYEEVIINKNKTSVLKR